MTISNFLPCSDLLNRHIPEFRHRDLDVQDPHWEVWVDQDLRDLQDQDLQDQS